MRSIEVPRAVRRLAPDRVRDDPRLRAVALALGVIPPRTMHSAAESAALTRLATGARRVVELGVYEGSSALVLCRALGAGAELHLVDPFIDASGWALRPGASASATATRSVVARAARGAGPTVVWRIARSQDVGRTWSGGRVDLVFIDGDHSPEGCREDGDRWHEHVAPGGAVAFHDAREGRAGGGGSPGPTSVVDEVFRSAGGGAGSGSGWDIVEEVDSLVVVRRAGTPGG
ncbi:MAG: 1-O-methyltransferase [Solirubrobacteraceae bacterium]|nr:1-O-methyltransferase [Solirubrobacteraceae bacterium]